MDKLQFKVSSALKDLIGRDLIINNNIAVFELVKNSYDAYATKVDITFEDNKLIIADNGKGMSLDDIKNKWLFLAYSAKKDGSEDSEEEKRQSYRDNINRHFAGAKGVGRFSCDRLGDSLILTTKKSNTNKTERIIADWTDFELDQKKEFENIDLIHDTIEEEVLFPENSKHGTILEILNLRAQWKRDDILNLKTSLEKLINPFSETSDFSIEIKCKSQMQQDLNLKATGNYFEKDIVNGIIKNSIAKVLDLKATKITSKLTSDYIETTITDRGTKIYKIREHNNFNKLNNVNIDLFYLNKAAKTKFTQTMGLQPVQYGSIFLFRNGFRILPYGQPNDDSWNINSRAQQGYSRFLSTRDLFGRVDTYTDYIDDIKEASSREGGLIESESSIQLFRLFDTIFKRLERYVVGVLWGERFLKHEYFKNKTLVDKNRELLKQDKELDNTDYLFKESIGSKVDFIQLVKTLIKDKNVEVLYYNKDLANIFVSQQQFDDINPQIISDLEDFAEKNNNSDLMSIIENAKAEINKLSKEKEEALARAEAAEARARDAEDEKQKAQYENKLTSAKLEKTEDENKELNKKVEQIESENLFLASDTTKDIKQVASLQHQITHSSSLIYTFATKAINYLNEGDYDHVFKFLNNIIFENTKISSLSNYFSKANFDFMSKKIDEDIINFVNEYMINVYSLAHKELHINVKKTNLKFKISFAPIDFIVILDNLIDNAKKSGADNIFINWEENNDNISLIFRDNGKGIKNDYMSKIFDYRFTTTGGGGLGLYHVKKVCDKMDIAISVNSILEKGTTFTLTKRREE